MVAGDDTWTANRMTRSDGRYRRGTPQRMCFANGHRRTTALLAGSSPSGTGPPMVLDEAIGGDWFEVYFRNVFASALRPGDIVVMDNLSGHKRVAAIELIEAAPAELRLLPFSSPDPNPIDTVFPTLKALLRKSAERTVQCLCGAIGRSVDLISPTESARVSATSGCELE
ncbi:MAG: transposase [Pseudomonadota bacterium]